MINHYSMEAELKEHVTKMVFKEEELSAGE